MDDLERVIEYYDGNAVDYIAKTSDIDMSDILGRFTSRLPQAARILDVGAGAGRDSRALLAKGFSVLALEQSYAIAKHLRTIEGLEVLEGKCGPRPHRSRDLR